MLPYNARISNQGFTLIETTIILVIVGILSAIAAPSFLSMLNKNKVSSALVQVQGALREAQRVAILRSKSCTVTIDTTNKKVTGPCLVTGDRNLEDIAVRSNISSITFNFRGGTGNSGTMVIALPNGTVTKQKCLAIASGIGIMRTGDYDDSDTTGTDPDKCTTSQ